MALYKEIELDNGVVASYWHITRIEVLKDQPMAWVQLYGYLNDKARFAGKNPCHNEMMEVIIPEEMTYSHHNLYSAVYSWIKENNLKFQGATDILQDPEIEESAEESELPAPPLATIPELG